VLAITPPLCNKKKLVEYPVPEKRDTSNSAGAVTKILAVKPVPEILKLCSAEGVPTCVKKVFKLAEKEIVGPLIEVPVTPIV
jgi:hypothetical protein